MSIKVKFTHLSVLILLLGSCTERLILKFDDASSILVVDGKITNAEGPYEVRLFRTADINVPISFNPEEGAVISIYDDKGNSDTFVETTPGVYNNITSSFQGTVGHSYWIEIQTLDGRKFESDPEVIPPEILIDSIYGEDSRILDNNGKYINGAKFYIDAVSSSNESHYMRWSYQESWEWHSPYFIPKTKHPAQVCYPYRSSDNILIFNGSKFNNKEFKYLYTNFINVDDVKLNHNYFLDISLYSINVRNYKFWKNIQEVNQDIGGIYDLIPSNAEGNICACENDGTIIGYFEASSVSTMNQIFTESDFEQDFSEYPNECEDIIIKTMFGPPDSLRYHIIESYIEEMMTVYIVKLNHCYDCNVKYSPLKPSFWP